MLWETHKIQNKGQILRDSAHEVPWQGTTQRNRMDIICGWAEGGRENCLETPCRVSHLQAEKNPGDR